MTANSDLLRRITARPDVFGGKPIIRDMQISVELILNLLAQGVSPKDILDDSGAGGGRHPRVRGLRPRRDRPGYVGDSLRG